MQKKTAQELKKRHKVRRLVNPTGAALSALNPAFKKVIRDMDKVDKKVRREAEDISYFVGMARSFYRRRDYLTAATYLTKVHEKIKLIHHQLNTFNGDISQSNRKFLLRQFRNRDKKQLFDYDPNKKLDEVKLVDDGQQLLSTAGTIKNIKDWWKTPGRFSDLAHNLTDRKSRSMRALESNFSDAFLSKLKEDTKEMLESTNGFYKNLLENFHNMGSAWGTRNIGAYLKEVNEINSFYKPYHSQYVKYYQDNILPMKEEQAKLDAEEDKAQQEANRSKLQENLIQSDPFGHAKEEVMPSTLPSADQPSGSFAPAPASIPFSMPSTKDAPTAHRPPDTRESEFAHVDTIKENTIPPTLRSPLPTQRSLPTQRPVPPPSIHRNIPAVTPTQRNLVPPPANRPPPPSNEPFSFSPKSWKDYSDVDHLMEYDLTKRKANEDFIGRIEKLSSDDEIIKEILSYSEEVEKYSEEESLKLLSIAEGMLEKRAGIFDAIKKKLNPGPETLPLKQDNPPESLAPVSNDDLLQELAPKNKLMPVEHGIPSGSVEKRWHQIPFLAKKRPEDIRLSSNSANVIISKIVKHLYHQSVPYGQIETFSDKLVSAVKKSVTKGQVVSNMACGDKHNSKDCQLEVFCYVRLGEIDPSPMLKDLILSFTASLRLSVFEGDITINTIKNPKLHNATK